MPDVLPLLEPLLRLHDEVRDRVLASTERQRLDELASISREEDGDTIYAIDAVSERTMRTGAPSDPIELIVVDETGARVAWPGAQ